MTPAAMGAESGGGDGGRRPRSREISEGRPPEIMIFQYFFFLDTYQNFTFSNIFKIK